VECCFLAQVIHRFQALAKSDGMRISLLAQIHHRFSALAKSDGMRISLLAQIHHRFSVSAKFDGMADMKCLNGLHPHRNNAVSDGDFRRNRQIGSIQ